MLTTQLLFGTSVIVILVVFHVLGLIWIARLLKQPPLSKNNNSPVLAMLLLLVIAVFGIILLHSIEAWGWAIIYFYIGEFQSMEDALYFSVVTSTTLGYGDVILTPTWRLLSSFEAMGGLILFSTSTAFLLGLMSRMFDGVIGQKGSKT